MSVRVQLQQFEGPLGLLLYLIRREEMDIYDIPIHKITKQYLEQLKLMAKLDLEVAGEFIAMAATLIHIKSRMLLPRSDEDSEEEENADPRKGLVQKLLDYQKYKEASKTLYDRPLLGRDVWSRGSRENFYSDEEGEIILEERGLFALISHYRKAMIAFGKRAHKVVVAGQSISSRVMEIKDRLIAGQKATLRSIMRSEETGKTKFIVTFLSILELSRMGFLSIFQSDVYKDIHIDTKRDIERDVIARVQEYDSADAESVAEKLFDDPASDLAFEVNELDENAEPEAEEDIQMSFTPEEIIEDAQDAVTDDEISAAERELGLGDIEEDIEFQAEKATDELKSIERVQSEPDILDEITAKYESDDENDNDGDDVVVPMKDFGAGDPEPTA